MCVCVCVCVCVSTSCRLFVTPGTAAPRLLRPWDFPGKNMRGLPVPSPGDPPGLGSEPASLALAGRLFAKEAP